MIQEDEPPGAGPAGQAQNKKMGNGDGVRGAASIALASSADVAPVHAEEVNAFLMRIGVSSADGLSEA